MTTLSRRVDFVVVPWLRRSLYDLGMNHNALQDEDESDEDESDEDDEEEDEEDADGVDARRLNGGAVGAKRRRRAADPLPAASERRQSKRPRPVATASNGRRGAGPEAAGAKARKATVSKASKRSVKPEASAAKKVHFALKNNRAQVAPSTQRRRARGGPAAFLWHVHRLLIFTTWPLPCADVCALRPSQSVKAARKACAACAQCASPPPGACR